MAPVTITMALAQFAPQLVRWLTGSGKAEEVAQKVVGVAEAVTGMKGKFALDAIGADPAAALEFRKAISAQEADLDKAFLADVANARERDKALGLAGQRNWRADLMLLLAVLVTVCLVLLVWRDPTVNEYLKGIVTLVLGRFLGYLDNIYNFEFGSTRSNKIKDATIEQLSR